jgi:methyl-accepting chemotaxis protein
VLYELIAKFKKKLQIKLTAILLVVVVVAIGLMGVVSIYFVKKNMEEAVYDKQRLVAESFIVEVTEYIAQHKNVLSFTAQLPTVKDMAAMQSVDERYLGTAENQDVEKRKVAKQLIKTYPEFSYFACYTDQGVLVMGEPYDKQIKTNLAAFHQGFTNKAWYQGAVATQGTYASEAMMSSIGTQVVMLATKITDDSGNMTGVWMASLDLDKLSAITKKLLFGKTGHAYLVDKNGALIAHPDDSIFKNQKEINLNESPIIQRVLKKEQGSGIFNDPISKNEVIGYYSPIEGTDWNIVVVQDKAEAFAAIKQIEMIMLMLGLCLAIVFSVVVYFVSKRIIKPILAVTEVTQKAADGDLTVQMAINSEDEIGQLAVAANGMIANLRNLVRGVESSAQQVAASSEELTASANQAALASNQVASAVTEVANGTEKQFREVNEASAVVEQMAACIQQASNKINQVAEETGKSVDSAQHGVTSAQTAIAQMRKIEQTVGASAEVVIRLGVRSKEIGQIVDSISGIAGQTNLLALNAAIEAARAGEQGRGFAVVAEEVRKLAEQSRLAAKQISALIGEIQGETEQAVIAMNEGSIEVKVGTEVVNEAGAAFNGIAGSSEQAAAMVSGILADMQEVVNGSQRVVDSVKKIDALSKTAAEETQTAAAATQEQSASMQEIASSSRGLANLAQNLQGAVSKFYI